MDLKTRIDLLSRLGDYILENGSDWRQAKERAGHENPWFTPEFVELATKNIAHEFLQKRKLIDWTAHYKIPDLQQNPKTVGVVMAGNLPLVGFHDFVAVFSSGHKLMIKLSSKDQVLLKHLITKLIEWNPQVSEYVTFGDLLKGSDAYIATGSNNSARYFESYFNKYPHIIRRNRTSVAVLNGSESTEELEKLADDVHQYFGLGCRNVTKIYVPKGYDFTQLLDVFKKYSYMSDFHKYRNNYDYRLALLLLNKQYYMTNGSILLVENKSPFSPISQLNYQYYSNISETLNDNPGEIQCVVGSSKLPFGIAQQPGLFDYADGVDTLQFLRGL